MEIITVFILIGMLIWFLYYQKQIKNSETVDSILNHFQQNIRETQQHFITLIETLYKRNEKELEVELRNKGFNQLEYIFNDIREQDIKNSKNAENSDKSRLEIELRIKYESNQYNQVIHLLKEQLDNRQAAIQLLEKEGHLNTNKNHKEQLDKQTDILLNGDLSIYYDKYNDPKHETKGGEFI